MSTPPKDIASKPRPVFDHRPRSRSWVHFAIPSMTLAQESVERDTEAASDEAVESDDDDDSDSPIAASAPTRSHGFSLGGAYQRPSFVGTGNRFLPESEFRGRVLSNKDHLSKEELRLVLEEERSLLRDNALIPPKHPQQEGHDPRRMSVISNILPHIPRLEQKPHDLRVPNGNGAPTEATPLLGDPAQPYGGQDDPKMIQKKWDEAIRDGKIQTTWQREAKTIASYSLPLMVTFTLQYSLTVASIFTVGHLGTIELGAVSLASMTANITGYAIYQGLATSLDTLCAQAYGSGHKKLVGLQMQRMVYFLWLVTIPIAIVWLCADKILLAIVPEPAVAKLAGLYLKIVLIGAPGFAAFEGGKRFVQAQGLFYAGLYVLIICAPLNAFLNWLFVWKLNFGFAGAPAAVAITNHCMPLGLFIYVRFVSKNGMSCWNGFTRQSLHNWGPMVKLALPGLIMLEAEVLAFEILTFASSYFGVTVLAAQSVVVTIGSIAFQLPFTLSIAASTRVANLIGATLADAAKLTTRVAFVGAVIVGVFNFTILSAPRNYLPLLFTSDPDVIDLVSSILPLIAAFQLVDAFAALFNGILRGLGRQHFGGYVQLFCYYVIAMPISFGLAFGLGWGLWGLWTGVAIALGLVAGIELLYLTKTDWETSVEEARQRNVNAV